jgi:DNA topoisomerase-2
MIIKKELVVSNKNKDKLVGELREFKFRPFPKSKKAQEEGEAEPALDEEDEGLASDYDYLLGMSILSLTAEKVCLSFGMVNGFQRYLQVEKLLQERDKKEEELSELLKLSPQDIWMTDLDQFMLEWEVSVYRCPKRETLT